MPQNTNQKIFRSQLKIGVSFVILNLVPILAAIFVWMVHEFWIKTPNSFEFSFGDGDLLFMSFLIIAAFLIEYTFSDYVQSKSKFDSIEYLLLILFTIMLSSLFMYGVFKISYISDFSVADTFEEPGNYRFFGTLSIFYVVLAIVGTFTGRLAILNRSRGRRRGV